jgi:hypothetical protein
LSTLEDESFLTCKIKGKHAIFLWFGRILDRKFSGIVMTHKSVRTSLSPSFSSSSCCLPPLDVSEFCCKSRKNISHPGSDISALNPERAILLFVEYIYLSSC